MGMPPFVSVITLPHCQKVTMSPGSSWIAVASYLQHIRSYNSSQVSAYLYWVFLSYVENYTDVEIYSPLDTALWSEHLGRASFFACVVSVLGSKNSAEDLKIQQEGAFFFLSFDPLAWLLQWKKIERILRTECYFVGGFPVWICCGL